MNINFNKLEKFLTLMYEYEQSELQLDSSYLITENLWNHIIDNKENFFETDILISTKEERKVLIVFRSNMSKSRKEINIENICYGDFNFNFYNYGKSSIVVFIDNDGKIKYLKNRYPCNKKYTNN